MYIGNNKTNMENETVAEQQQQQKQNEKKTLKNL